MLFDQKCGSYIKIHMVKQKPFRKNSPALHFHYHTQQHNSSKQNLSEHELSALFVNKC